MSLKRILHLIVLITVLAFLRILSYGQCSVNSGCPAAPIFSIDPPIFDAAISSIVLNNVTFGEISCAAPGVSGLVIYVYQLLPNGDRMELCNSLNPPPFNVIAAFPVGFGSGSLCGLGSMNIGSIFIDSSDGFQPCDGALLEIEAVLFTTDNTSFDLLSESVYTALSADEFISLDLGTLEINTNNEFPGGGQPLTTAVINEFATGSDGPLTVNCGENVDLYVEGLSRLANCLPYDDISTGFASELFNVFSDTINNGAPIILNDASTGNAGGQLTGPDPALGGLCYAGLLTTPNNPYTVEWNNLPADLCDGATVVFTISTTDVFTGLTVSDDITIIYSGSNCTICDMEGCTDSMACNFDAAATMDNGSCLYNDCEGTCGGTAVAGTVCTDVNGNGSTYAADCICTICEEEITGTVSASDACDVSGIDIIIAASDGTSATVTTGTDGSFSVPGGPFPCGIYTATFFDIGQLPDCYTETGSVEPINFMLNGTDSESNDVEFSANPNIPTLSQWGIIILALLLMCFGAIQLIGTNFNTNLRIKGDL